MEFQMVNRETAEKVFISVYNNAGGVLQPGMVPVWTATTTTANQGYHVQYPGDYRTDSGISARVAGVVESTITTAGRGRLQVYGPADVKASATIDAGKVVVAASFQDTMIAVVADDGAVATRTDFGVSQLYKQAVVGITLCANPTTYTSRVHLALL